MADHTLTLTAAEEQALTAWLERTNTQRAREQDDDGQTLEPLTAEQFLHVAVRNDLVNIARELNGTTDELLRVARNLTAAQRNALMAQIPEGAREAWLQARIQTGQ